jgi:hypothetical protein
MVPSVTAILEIGESAVVILLVGLCGLTLIGVMVAVRISGRLARIERLLARRSSNAGASHVKVGAKASSRSAAGDFERFILEDPARRTMSKKEQFAAYRAWRKEKGLSWQGGEHGASDEKETKG